MGTNRGTAEKSERILDKIRRSRQTASKPYLEQVLRGLKQNNRPLATFLTEARLLIQSSGYPPDLHDELMREKLVFGTDSEEVRRKCIARGNDLTFAKAKEIARTDEATQMQLKAMTDNTPKQEEGEVNAMSKGNGPGNQSYHKYTSGRGSKRHDNNPRQCHRCGDTSHTKGEQCPAIGIECFNCHKRGHFSKVCKSKTRSDVMTLKKEQPDDITSECSSYDKVFLGNPRQLQYLNDRKHRAAKKPQQSHDRNTSHSRPP